MKNIYILFCAVVISISSIAQVLDYEKVQSDLQFDENQFFHQVPSAASNVSSAAPIWEEDFSGGFPAGWSTYTINTGVGNNATASVGNTATAPWKYSMTGSWGYWNSVGTNAAGNPTAAAAPINSTTSANGFLISDIDSANHWNGNSGASSGSSYHFIESYFTTSAIDLSGFPNVSLQFEHSFRLNNSVDLTVSVSNDSISWTTYNIQGNAANNQASSDPEYLILNISSVAGNSATTYIKVGWNARVYFWMLDDMKIIETPNNLLSSGAETFGGWWIGYQSTGDIGTDFTFYPKNQADAQPYRFEGVLSNQGVNTQDNSILHVNVMDELGASQDFTSNPISVSSGINDTVATATNFTPAQTGAYTFSYWATSDSFPTTDTAVMSAIVTDTVYGVDYDWNSDGANAGSGYFLGKPCGGNVLGNVFDVYAVDTVTSISFHVNESSAFGNDVKVQLYNIDDPSVIDPIALEDSDDYQLQASDIDSWVTLKLLNPYPVTTGTAYLAAVKGSISLQDTTMISSSSNDNSSSWLQDNCVATTATSTHVPGDWYTISKPLLIRMNFGTIASPSGINNIKQSQFNLYPNPTDGVFIIELEENSKYKVTVIDILGKTVFSTNTNGMNTSIDLSSFDKGIYTVELKDANAIYTEKLIVE
jgi:hypothetical protein